MRLMAQPDPSELLQRVREKVLNTLDRLPRYMCTQTINRSVYEPVRREVEVKDCGDPRRSDETGGRLVRTMADRVRLDVGVAAQGEIYSWVGENRFRNRSLSIVNEGYPELQPFPPEWLPLSSALGNAPAYQRAKRSGSRKPSRMFGVS